MKIKRAFLDPKYGEMCIIDLEVKENHLFYCINNPEVMMNRKN